MDTQEEPVVEAQEASQDEIFAEHLKVAVTLLNTLLQTYDGCISTTYLKRQLQNELRIENADGLIYELKFLDAQTAADRGIEPASVTFKHLGRSFYNDQRFAEVKAEQDKAVEEVAETASQDAENVEVESLPQMRQNKQEEARLGTYVISALEGIYESPYTPEDSQFVFDVHASRTGTSFENVDALAFHWRPHGFVETIAVEVKLEFDPKSIQQAMNYKRFAHRVWIAVRVQSEDSSELFVKNGILFDYAVANGIGILACRRSRGSAYVVWPVQWPTRNRLEELDVRSFQERYRNIFEDAGILEKAKKNLPRLAL